MCKIRQFQAPGLKQTFEESATFLCFHDFILHKMTRRWETDMCKSESSVEASYLCRIRFVYIYI